MFGHTRFFFFCSPLLFTIVCLLVACSNPAELERLPADAVILAFGNSLTYGTGVSRLYSYPRVLETLIDIKVVNAGVPGEVTREGLRRLPQMLAQYDPQLVILCHGGNDILRQYDPAETEENLKAMIQMIQDHGSQVVLVAVPKIGLFPSAADYYEEIAGEFDIPIEKDIIADLETKARYKSDSIHFNKEGYALMAQALAELLAKSGAM